MNLEENSIVSNKPQDDDRLELSDSVVMAERASITADHTSTSALGDEPTYDEQVHEDIEAPAMRMSSAEALSALIGSTLGRFLQKPIVIFRRIAAGRVSFSGAAVLIAAPSRRDRRGRLKLI
jgi:hypothetical protein